MVGKNLPREPPPVFRGHDTGGYMRVGGTVVPPKVSIAPPRGGSGTGTATPPRPSSLQPNQWKVFLIVMAGLGISAMPFFFRSVRRARRDWPTASPPLQSVPTQCPACAQGG